MPRIPLVNTLDKERILNTVANSSGTPPDYISQMLKRIYSAIPVDPTQVPDQLVTMNSIVRIQDTETDEIDIYALVYNEAYDHQAEWISVNSKLGSALLGRSVGDEIEIPSRRGSHTVRILDLEYQPERSGHFDR
ncbi:MAG: GreA/GreB family elongation factor [Phycisphaerales bacterium]|nr:GreA/GreB family elongation factor [Phycisphaerales bacterium]|tara:strand:- start:982 stop:1386 length:405 start_codon:yes stop_codon:yes gene_type:complete